LSGSIASMLQRSIMTNCIGEKWRAVNPYLCNASNNVLRLTN
jgi:hypothetical protein